MARLTAARRPPDEAFESRLAGLRAAGVPTVDRGELERVVDGVISSLSGAVTLGDLRLYREVEALGDYIQSARREIAGLRPDAIRERDIPMATDELDAVVTSTAEATGVILGAMEQVEGLLGEMPGETAATIQDIVVRVYEACGFQDITGQRITKVVRALKHIEAKIDALLAVFGSDIDLAVALPDAAAPLGEAEKLLNGPALPGAANSQDDIDAILASFD
jgi:chemotaxis protein CheZ